MDEELKSKLIFLHLRNLIETWEHYLSVAQKSNFSHTRLLKYIIDEEYKIKKEKSRKARLKRAKLEEHRVIETYPFHKQPKLNKKKIIEIYDSFDYITKKRNLVFIGPTGTGKTGLATSFMIHTINQGYKGRFITFPDLVDILYKSVADHSENKIINKFLSYDCLLIDELGYVEVDPVQVGLFFTLLHKRYKQKTTIITTNLGFSQWNAILKNQHLTAALIDRLTEDSYVINMRECKTLRPKRKPV